MSFDVKEWTDDLHRAQARLDAVLADYERGVRLLQTGDETAGREATANARRAAAELLPDIERLVEVARCAATLVGLVGDSRRWSEWTERADEARRLRERVYGVG